LAGNIQNTTHRKSRLQNDQIGAFAAGYKGRARRCCGKSAPPTRPRAAGAPARRYTARHASGWTAGALSSTLDSASRTNAERSNTIASHVSIHLETRVLVTGGAGF